MLNDLDLPTIPDEGPAKRFGTRRGSPLGAINSWATHQITPHAYPSTIARRHDEPRQARTTDR
jgi:hypothetical protein